MARVPDRSALRRPGLRSDPGLRAPVEAFGAGIGEALGIAGGELQAAAERVRARRERAARERRNGEEKTPKQPDGRDGKRPPLPGRKPQPPLPGRKPPTPGALTESLRRGATTAARRAQAATGRREMTEAARQVLDGAEQPAAGLPAAVKAQAEAALKSRLSQARKAGLGEDDLARLEAELGGHQLVLLEQGLVEQVARLRAQTAAQLESEAGALVEAAAALDELLADFAAGADPALLAAFAGQTRARLALAEVEGFLADGEPEVAAEALAAAQDLPEAARVRLERRIGAERANQPEDNQGLAEHARAAALAALEAGRGPDPETLAQIAMLAGPEALAGLEAEAETAARRRDLAGQLSGRPREAWDEALAKAGVGPEARAAVLRLAEPLRRRVELDPRAAVAARVEARIAALAARGQLRTPAQEARARRFFAAAFQRQAGIVAPRLFTNQERADWGEAYRDAEPAARPALLLAARAGGADPGDETIPPDQAALAELIAGLPAELRAEAESRAATIAELEEAGIDPASIDLTRADPDSLYGLRDPRLAPSPAQAPQLAQAGAADVGGAAGEGEEPRGPSEREINAFLSETADLSDEAFRDAAAGFGLDPEMAGLFRDMLRVTPETEAEVRQQIETLLPFGFGAPRNEVRTVLDQILMTEEEETRRQLIEPQLKFGRADRDLAADAAAGGFRPGAPRPTRQLGIAQGGGRKGPGSKPGEDGDPGAPQGGRPTGPGGVGLSVGQPDPVLTSRTIVQPVEDRRKLLEMAAQARPDFDRQLEAIAKSVPGTKFDLSRVKEDGPRLTFKIKALQDDMRVRGVDPASTDSGAHLIRDYLAGRLVPENDKALTAAIAQIGRRFELVGEPKNFMVRPRSDTGYTAIHVQIKLKNGLTAELQIMPPPFKKAADRQRSIFERYRDFDGKIPPELWPQYEKDLRRSRNVFEQAWSEWLAAGNQDPRVKK